MPMCLWSSNTSLPPALALPQRKNPTYPFARRSSQRLTSIMLSVKRLLKNMLAWVPNDTDGSTDLPTGNEHTSKLSFLWDNGRRFQAIKNAAYVLPNDDQEIDHMHQQHWMLKHAFKGNYQAPVTNLLEQRAKVLDCGCGPGTWLLEMAKSFPNSEFYGIDLSRVFPQFIKPANTCFYLHNLADRLPFEDNTFDFVYQRLLMFGIKSEEWLPVIKELYRVCKPDGWIELVEVDLQLHRRGTRTKQLVNQTQLVLQARGLDPFVAGNLHNIVKESGFKDVKHTYVSLPVNWGGQMGQLQMENTLDLFQSAKPWFSRIIGKESDEYDEQLAAFLGECASNKSYVNWHCAYGRKPDETPVSGPSTVPGDSLV